MAINKTKPKTKKRDSLSNRLKMARTRNLFGYFWNGAPCNASFHVCKITGSTDVPLYWANVYSNTEREIAIVKIPNQTEFAIDNGDGTGWVKMLRTSNVGNVFYRGLLPGTYEIVSDVTPDDAQKFDIVKYNDTEKQLLEWMKTQHPEIMEQLSGVDKSIEQSGE
jgi:hypothetical protein